MSPLLFTFLLLHAPAQTDGNTGGVALVVNIPDDNAALRAVAAGAVDGAREKWGLLNPPIKPEEVEACGAVDVCLNNLAQDRGASHLFIIGVANLGEGEVVVSLKLFDSVGAEVLTYTDVLTLGADPRSAGHDLVNSQSSEVTDLPEPGTIEDQWPPPPPPTVTTYSGLSLLSGAGWAMVGTGAAVGMGALTLGILQTTGALQGVPASSRDVTVLVAAPIVLGLVATGLGLTAVDLFVQ